MGFFVTREGSIINAEGKNLFFGIDHFVRDIAEGDCCFLCGVQPNAATFNDEHVIPDWVLRRYQLHHKHITIPGGTTMRYDQYKVPCCQNCNAFMGETIEAPIADLFARGYKAFVDDVRANGPLRLYVWMNLLFLKTHLKDRSLRLTQDRRRESSKIGELYDWSELHHIHCFTRVPYTRAAVDPTAIGTVAIFPAKTDSPFDDFDYGDYLPGRAIFVRLGEVFVLCVLNDACGVSTMLRDFFARITGPLSAWQCRALMSNAAYANLLMKNRPFFRTEVDFADESLCITAQVPKTLQQAPFVKEHLGSILHYMLHSSVQISDVLDKEEVLEQLKNGHGLLFDDKGHFVDRPL